MYYEFYIDVFFVVNLVMDFLLLRLVNRVLKGTATPGRCSAGSCRYLCDHTAAFIVPLHKGIAFTRRPGHPHGVGGLLLQVMEKTVYRDFTSVRFFLSHRRDTYGPAGRHKGRLTYVLFHHHSHLLDSHLRNATLGILKRKKLRHLRSYHSRGRQISESQRTV